MDNCPLSASIETRVVASAGSHYQIYTEIFDLFNGTTNTAVPTVANKIIVVVGFMVSSYKNPFSFRFETGAGKALTLRIHLPDYGSIKAFEVREYFQGEVDDVINYNNYGGEDGYGQIWYYLIDET